MDIKLEREELFAGNSFFRKRYKLDQRNTLFFLLILFSFSRFFFFFLCSSLLAPLCSLLSALCFLSAALCLLKMYKPWDIAEAVVLLAAWLLPVVAWLLSQKKGPQLGARHREVKRLLVSTLEEVVRAEVEASAVGWIIGPFEALLICLVWMLPFILFLTRRYWHRLAETSSRCG